MSNPLISVCMNAQNEGPRVKGTVVAFQEHLAGVPHEILVADDGTTDGCCDDLPAGTIVVRNEKRIGCARSKRKLTEAASGQVLCFVDAHQAPFVGSMKESAERILSRETPAVVSPLTCRMEFDMADKQNWKARRSGQACLAPNEFGLPPNGTKQYRHYTSVTAKDPARMIGVGVMVRRQDLLNLGGWTNFVGWRGSQERGLTLKAFMAGYDIVLDNTLVIGHEFAEQKNASRKKFPYPPTSMQDWAKCQWHAWAAVLRQETFEQHIMPTLLGTPKAAYCPGHHLEPHVVEERDWFAANAKRRDDQELLDLIAEIRQREAIPPDTGGGALEPASLAHVRQHAIGRCLEFGTGTGASAKAMLESDKATVVVSVEDVPTWTVKANASIKDPRVMFVVLKRKGNGFYDVDPLLKMGMKFDFVLIDGPPGTKARVDAFPSILPLLADGATVLVDDGKRDEENIQRWKVEHGAQAEMLPSHRGLYRIVL